MWRLICAITSVPSSVCGQLKRSLSRRSVLPTFAAPPLCSRRFMWITPVRVCGCGAGLDCRPFHVVRQICSTFLSTAVASATKWYPMRFARPIRTCSIMVDILPLCCFWKLPRRMSMSMCIRPSTRCVSAKVARYTVLFPTL